MKLVVRGRPTLNVSWIYWKAFGSKGKKLTRYRFDQNSRSKLLNFFMAKDIYIYTPMPENFISIGPAQRYLYDSA